MTVPPQPGEARRRSRTRSFTRRGSRMPEGHQRAYDVMAADFVVPVPRAASGDDTSVDPAYRLDPVSVFGRSVPLVVEVGSGSGDALRAGAQARADWDFLGLEVWRPGIGQTLARMRSAPLTNLRLAEVDAALAVETMLRAASVRELWTFFPDPWPKRRHHERRLVNPGFADAAAAVLEPGGVWRLATDWAAYGRAMRGLLDADDRFTLTSTEPAPLRPVTRFERKGLDVDRVITDLSYTRR
ncbi:MAG TPA: tRNA (guanosine(46)-N7)-methyltransferase TrmB [Ornithinimicrobium sp.]|uniref:tRNA (guanosine(46)-N7)-methyltransferase TrmB n=1 Tax=Ornithinimicrobium sp. TaxID=1977084 RepID=UPI002B4637FE|nr:tRNA (guanosine(46)-N7)-methyltransferase TrmB [Ornithinimicrobium sp.]HKJ12007.1 tRNA (guanosine(46)-N7)-methyltransferase TrmB [Ornithinimicrobium sp.]